MSEAYLIGELGDGIMGIFIGIGICIFLIFFSKMIYNLVSKDFPTKSQRYRKYLTNLYVAGRIKQEAEKDKVDLEKEDKLCMQFVENQSRKDLDDKIEQELAKKINNENKK
jgi:hypothetical protein